MTTPLNILTSILDLEAERHQDRAVFGGLGGFAKIWLEEAPESFAPEAADWIERVAERLRAYSALESDAQRSDALREIQQLVSDAPPEAPKPEPAPAPPPAAPSSSGTAQMAEEGRAETSHPEPVVGEDDRVTLDSPVTALRGVGPVQSQRLATLGVDTIRDLLYFFPRRYNDLSKSLPINRLEYGQVVSVTGRVVKVSSRKTRSRMDIFTATLDDGTKSIDVTWFNQPYLSRAIRRGQMIVVGGQVNEYLGRLCFNSPEWEPLSEELLHTNRISPVYPLTEGLKPRGMRRLMKPTVDYWSMRLPDHLPSEISESQHLMDLETAISQIHFPDNDGMLDRARRRLAFDEVFLLQLGLLIQRRKWRAQPGQRLDFSEAVVRSFIDHLPFRLTAAQRRVLAEILDDLRADRPMLRLLQGDVGSGKTVVAAAAMVAAVAAGTQAALMAPTEILAEQHYATLARLLQHIGPRRPSVELLTGSLAQDERQRIYAGLAAGSVDIVVGTHALIQESVTFANLGLVVVDEQHRFGVLQRVALQAKGHYPHTLTMTATPIPRSLALTVWGHMDVSTIDELPQGRRPITTYVLEPAGRERAYSLLRKQVEMGHQAFIICPLVQESDLIQAKSAVEEFERLRNDIFPDLRLGLLHGQMRGDEKEDRMAQFTRGDFDILVATSVVEVGIDVPNATVMVVESAERFGLAQLHQFRGRVGRGGEQSYCLLVAESPSDTASERLAAMTATTDGFELAEKDLEMRGPGEFLGTRQAGFPDLSLAEFSDPDLVEAARQSAQIVFQEDPELARPGNRLLTRRMDRFWAVDTDAGVMQEAEEPLGEGEGR